MSEDGGAMAEEDETSEKLEGDRDAEARVDPENGGFGKAATKLQDKAGELLEEHLLEIVDCILANVRKKHLPSVTMLLDLSNRVRANEDVPEETYQSLADVLWAAKQQEVQRERKQAGIET